MYLLKINRPDDNVYCTITYDRGQKGYRFVNLSHNHICPCVFKTIDEAFKDLDRMKNEGLVLSYNVISPSFNIDVVLKQLFG